MKPEIENIFHAHLHSAMDEDPDLAIEIVLHNIEV